MNFAIKAKFLGATNNKPSRVKFSNGHNTITREICVNGDSWIEVEKLTSGKTVDIIKLLACNYAENALNWHYTGFEIGMLKEYPAQEFVIIPVGEKIKKKDPIKFNLF